MDITLSVDDDGFVRAPAARCYRVLTNVAAWPGFWPSTRVADHGADRFSIVAGRGPRRLRLRAVAGTWRHETGFTLDLDGDLRGRWEIWLEPGWGGTVVHHVLDARGSAPWQLGCFRRWVRHGAWGLKDELEHGAPPAPVVAGPSTGGSAS